MREILIVSGPSHKSMIEPRAPLIRRPLHNQEFNEPNIVNATRQILTLSLDGRGQGEGGINNCIHIPLTWRFAPSSPTRGEGEERRSPIVDLCKGPLVKGALDGADAPCKTPKKTQAGQPPTVRRPRGSSKHRPPKRLQLRNSVLSAGS